MRKMQLTDKQTDNSNFIGRSSGQWEKFKFGKVLLSLTEKK